MGEFKFAKKVPQTDANCILKDFAEHYVDKEKLRKYGLMWNSFARKPKCISMEEIRDIPIPPEDRVFFYDERAWLLCSEDYDMQGDKAWQWNEWELLSLKAAENDAATSKKRSVCEQLASENWD